MARIFGLLVATIIFSAFPSLLLMFQYNAAVAVAYFALSLTVLSSFWELSGISEELKRGSSGSQEVTLHSLESRLVNIEMHLSEISASASSIDHNVSKFLISQLPEHPPDGP
jgi:hypothetical protein